MMLTPLVLFGSNIEAVTNFQLALQKLNGHDDLQVRQVSNVYESAAVTASGETDTSRPAFHNAAIVIETTLNKVDLHLTMRQIEQEMGRRRTEDKYADRTVDLDIVGYCEGDFLVEADPVLWQQAYAAIPSAEIKPGLQLPDGKTLGEIDLTCKRVSNQIGRAS
jgi:2-amino-4-hydroxy-6-hydroxymethyldihydropteridine diphosphokinase